MILIFVGLFEESVLLKLHDLSSFQTNKLYKPQRQRNKMVLSKWG